MLSNLNKVMYVVQDIANLEKNQQTKNNHFTQ